MPGHGSKTTSKPEVAAQIAEFPCWYWHLVQDRIYELQAGRRVEIGHFAHCVRRYLRSMPDFELTPMQKIDHPTAACPECRYETTRWRQAIRFFSWRSKLTKAYVIDLMARQLDSGNARGSMEITAPTVRYTEQEAAANYDKPKPREEEEAERAAAPGLAMPTPMRQGDL